MNVLPVLILGLLEALIKCASVGALSGAIFGAIFGGGGESWDIWQKQKEVGKEEVREVGEGAVAGSIEGAIGGALFGCAMGAVSNAIGPVLKFGDNILKRMSRWFDDAARGVAKVADDAVKGIDDAANAAAKGIRGTFNRLRNACNVIRNCPALPKPPAGTEYVYIIEDTATGLYKIGKTAQMPKTRINGISNAIKSKVDYTCISEVSKDRKLESILHKDFSNQRTIHPTPHSGFTEWFVLTAADVAQACSR